MHAFLLMILSLWLSQGRNCNVICMLDVVYKYANSYGLTQVNVGYGWWDRRKVGSCGL